MPQRCRILFVNNFPGPGLGGGEVLLMHLVRGCVAAGWQTSVLCPSETALAAQATAAGAAVKTMSMRPGSACSIVGEIRRQATNLEIVVGTGYFTNLLTRLAAVATRVRVVNLVQVDPAASRADGGSRGALLVRNVADATTRSRADAFITVSEAVGRALAASGVAPVRVHVVRNGVDAQAIRAAAVREPLTVALPAGEGPLVGCVARLEKVKGVADFVDAAAVVARDVPDARFVVAGSGSQEQSLIARRAAAPAGRLEFLGHTQPVEPLLAALDVLVLPSLSEALGLALLEAGALGVPVVATAVGGIPEVVEDGVTGILVPPGQPAAVADAVTRLLSDPAAARAMGEAARERVEREFTLERMVAGHLAVYESLLGSQGR
jgi:glycosyltransferase involved in cell wall biosynthesis